MFHIPAMKCLSNNNSMSDECKLNEQLVIRTTSKIKTGDDWFEKSTTENNPASVISGSPSEACDVRAS